MRVLVRRCSGRCSSCFLSFALIFPLRNGAQCVCCVLRSRQSSLFMKNFGLSQVIKPSLIMTSWNLRMVQLIAELCLSGCVFLAPNCFQRFYIYDYKMGISEFKACLGWLLFQLNIYLQLGNGMGMQPTLIPFLVVLGGVLSNRLQNKLIREGEGQSPFAR